MCVRLNLPEWLTALSQPGVQNAQLTLSGSKAVASSNWLLTTVAYQLDGKRTYALEGVCYQTNDLLEAMKWDWGARGQTILRVDGGMTASAWTMQFLANILGAPVDRPVVLETTALGAAYLAGRQAGFLPKPEVFAKTWRRQKRVMPQMDAETRSLKLAGWAQAVRKPLT